MNKNLLGAIAVGVVAATTFIARKAEKSANNATYTAELMEPIETREMSFYEKRVKRILDVACSAGAIICFSPIYVGVALAVKLKLGSPVLFTQERPGIIDETGKETIFKMYKFRTMTDERDEDGNLLSDEERLTKFGAWLRSTSLDELPEAFNILNGTMSVIGPRPQLIKDMTFMTDEQRKRHTAKPGLSGLAQINGRNSISWEEKINWDCKYIENVGIAQDFRIVLDTIRKAFLKQEGINQDDMATAEDYGDYLLRTKKVSINEYGIRQKQAKQILYGEKTEAKLGTIAEKYSVLMSLYIKEDAENFRMAIYSMINQSLPPDEIVLVEDGPLTDELYGVINEVKELYPGLITSVIHEKNQGLGFALQHGLEAARNEIVARMDTDDIAIPGRCKKQLEYLNKNLDITIVGGQIEEFIGRVSNVIGKREVPITDAELKKYIQKRCPFNHMTVMFRKTDIMDVGNYKDWFWNEDYYLWIRLAIAGKRFANLPETMVMVRTGADMYQRRGGTRYFKSELDIQKYMVKNNIIGYRRFCINATERFILQVLMPNRLRGFVFKTFARKKAK